MAAPRPIADTDENERKPVQSREPSEKSPESTESLQLNDKGSNETRWWWIRHAPVPNSVHIYGQSDVDCDVSSAEVFAALANELPRDAVWLTSNLSRTRQTAAAILAAMNHAAEPVAITEFAEQNLGEWQGQVRADFFARRDRSRYPFWFGPADERAPGGESFADVCARVAPAIERLNKEFSGRNIIAVAHGGSIRAALGHSLGLDPDTALAFVVDNCSISRIDRIQTSGFSRVVTVNHRPWLGAAKETQSRSLA
jgi:alpha-ribazole phosphatase